MSQRLWVGCLLQGQYKQLISLQVLTAVNLPLVTLTISNNNQQANGQSAVNLDVVVRDC